MGGRPGVMESAALGDLPHIDCTYNPERIQQYIGYRSPGDFESAVVA